MSAGQEELKRLESQDAIKNELVRVFTQQLEEPTIYDDNVIPVKMVVLGPPQVGKTCWLTRLVEDTYNDKESPTVGAKYSTQAVAIQEKEYNFEIWDVSGEEWCKSLCPMYLQHCHVAVICYDPSNLESFEASKEWVEYVKKQGDKDLIICFVGMKHDLATNKDPAVSVETAKEFFVNKQKLKAEFFFPEVSAKEGSNVEDPVLTVAEALDTRGITQTRYSAVNAEQTFSYLVDTALENPPIKKTKSKGTYKKFVGFINSSRNLLNDTLKRSSRAFKKKQKLE